MNKTEEIKALLNKFYDGNTSEEEEALLQSYFSSDDVVPELIDEKAFFCALASDDAALPAMLLHQVNRQIDQWNMLENRVNRYNRVMNMRWIAGTAAGLVLLFAAGIGIYQHRQQSFPSYSAAGEQVYADTIQPLDTYKHPKDAYAEASWALKKFSKSIRKGLNMVNKKGDIIAD